MTLSTRISRIRKAAPALAIAAFSAVGFFGLGAGSAEAAPHKVRCVAAAETHFGREIRGTREVSVRRRGRRACGVALRECRQSLDRKRVYTGRPFPLAKCKVQKRERLARYGHQFRCAAEAFTRRGRSLSHTKSVEIRKHRRAACRVAINRCEARLDRKRHLTGKRFPYARCEVIGSKKIARFDDQIRIKPVGLRR